MCPSCGCATHRNRAKSSRSDSGRGLAAPGLILSLVTLVVMMAHQFPADGDAAPPGFLLVILLSIASGLLSGFAYAKIVSSGKSAGRLMSMMAMGLSGVCLVLSAYIFLG